MSDVVPSSVTEHGAMPDAVSRPILGAGPTSATMAGALARIALVVLVAALLGVGWLAWHYNQQLVEVTGQLVTTTNDLGTAQGQIAELQQGNDQLQSTVVGLSQQLDAANAQLNQVTGERDAAKTTAAQLAEDRDRVVADRDRLSAQLADSAQRVSTLANQLTDTQQQRNAAQQQRDTLGQMAVALANAGDALYAYTVVVDQQLADALAANNAAVAGDWGTQNRRIAAYNARRSTYQAKLAAAKDAMAKLNSLLPPASRTVN